MAGINFKGVLKGIIFSVLVTFLTMVIITVITYFSNISTKAVDIIIFIGFGIGVFSGAFPVSKSAEEKSAIHGILVGVGVTVLFLICSFFVNRKIVFNSHLTSIVLVSLLSGFLGGFLGR